MDKVSYALGLSIGFNFETSGIKSLSITDFTQGLQDVLENQNLKLSHEEAKKIINEYFQRLQEEKYENNKAAGAEFLLINGHRSDVTTLPSGVQFQILKEGSGEKPTPTSTVKCHYHGTLINGVVFDSSVERGQPASFPVNGVIKGWQEILPMMPVGSKWKVTIPYQHAYGAQQAGQLIEPYSTLIFEIELLEIEK